MVEQVRRRDKRFGFVLLGIFVAVFLFSFLTRSFKKVENEVEAASLAGFDPGYIISDYQMGNYNSMSEAEIQAFLTSKNPCGNWDYNYYQQLSANNPGVIWHFDNGHFICLSEEKFGDGEVIGSGETAAHIIWQAAQDYRINPQVLLVLLQKETSLITDPIPNNYDYRKATGFGCPDTAACSSKYYGFKNQIRNAADLFSTVLNGGWTNYPLGENYIQYNPNANCGGSVVNIRSLATSALYRYTPYQPNSGALAAGYGTAYCGAYGNRNFYLYFEDWFGGITSGGGLSEVYERMIVPRVLYVKEGARYIEPGTNKTGTRGFSSFEYFSYLNYSENELCLSLDNGRNCYLYSDLEEMDINSGPEDMMVPRMLITKDDIDIIDYMDSSFVGKLKVGNRRTFSDKVVINNELCLKITEEGTNCVLYSGLEELPEVSVKDMIVPRYFYVSDDSSVINTSTGIASKGAFNRKVFFNKSVDWFGELCLSNSQTLNGSCVLYSDLQELNDDGFETMTVPRFLKVTKGIKEFDVETGKENDVYNNDEVLFFNRKGTINGELCLSVYVGVCVKYKDLIEVGGFEDMVAPRFLTMKTTTSYYTWGDVSRQEKIAQGKRLYFVDKIKVDGKLCLRTDNDANNKVARCIMYDSLEE